MALQATNVVKTFTLNSLGYGRKKLKDIVTHNPGKTVLLNVLAFVTGYEVVTNKKDNSKSSLKFVGSFEIVDLESSEEVVAASAFLPGPAEMFLKGQLDGLGEAGGSIRQALQITVETDDREDAITGYKFGMKGFVDKKSASDPFADLRSVFPALPAPEKKAKK